MNTNPTAGEDCGGVIRESYNYFNHYVFANMYVVGFVDETLNKHT